jgi:small subunit ribosomal protein S4
MANNTESKNTTIAAKPVSADQKAREQKRGSRKRISQYGMQLIAKQKVKRTYGLREKQFRKYYDKALKMKGVTGTDMLVLLERRLDNVVFRMGIGPTRRATRQIVSHGHICVNGSRVNIPSYIVKKGDIISVKENKLDKEIFKELKGMKLILPSWVEFDTETLTGKVISYPVRDEIDADFEELLIIELYSR